MYFVSVRLQASAASRNRHLGVLPGGPEISDKDVIVAEVATHWNHTEVLAQKEQVRAERFEWAQYHNERRRELARKRPAA